MNKYIVAYDVETTGVSSISDKVIQLSAVKFDLNFNIIAEFDTYIMPIGVWHMSEGAFKVHGISESFLREHGKPMKDVAREFSDFIDGCDLLSYNGNKFDIKILTKDFREVGYSIDLDSRVFYDSYLLEAKLYSRTLSNIYKKYTGKTLDGAHNSLNDVKATVEVFKHQVECFKQETADDIFGYISEFDESKLLCVDGSIKRGSNPNEPEQLVFARGKWVDVDIMEVCKRDMGYMRWFMESSDTDVHTKNLIRNYYAKNRDKLKN
jgi:DNA polymerase III epsilon subunit-like protein